MTVTIKDIISINVDECVISKAISIRNERDKKYGNLFQEKDSDLRWVGEVGEIIINDFLCLMDKANTEWILDDVTTRGDFNFAGIEIDVKTVKRKVPIRPWYKAQITARHAAKPVDYLIFTCYEYPVKKLHILGVMKKDEFLSKATYYGAGSKVHDDYVIRDGHEIYAITISEMMPIMDFINFAMQNTQKKEKA